MNPFDAIIIGAGQAGPSLAGRLTAAGQTVAIDEGPAVDDIVLLDPVCGMTVDRAHARHLAEHEGVVYAFCSVGCRTAFIKEPETYLSGEREPSHPA